MPPLDYEIYTEAEYRALCKWYAEPEMMRFEWPFSERIFLDDGTVKCILKEQDDASIRDS
jgi:hypothetical protein